MNALRNRVQLIGRLGADPKMFEIANGTKKASFSVATNEFYRRKDGERQEETHWHNVVAWGKTAEIAEKILRKGNEVAVNGKLVSRSYEDNSGNKKYITEVIVSEFLLLVRKN